MTDENEPGEEGYVQLNVRVPRKAKEQASEKLPHGGLTREVRERIEEIATGRQTDVEQLLGDLEDLRDERRETAADLEQLHIEIERTERELLQLVKDRVG